MQVKLRSIFLIMLILLILGITSTSDKVEAEATDIKKDSAESKKSEEMQDDEDTPKTKKKFKEEDDSDEDESDKKEAKKDDDDEDEVPKKKSHKKSKAQRKKRKNNVKRSTLLVQLCLSWSYKSYFEDAKNFVEDNFDNIEVIGEEYPLSPTRTFLSYVLTASQFIFLGSLFVTEQIKPFVTKYVKPEYFKAIEENKMSVGFFIFFFWNILRNMVTNTGAMEMYLDGKLIWSKLETGNVPDFKTLAALLKNTAN